MTTKKRVARKDLVKREMTYNKELYEALLKRKEETGMDITEQVRRAVERDLSKRTHSDQPLIPLLGEIPAGPTSEVCPAPPGVYIQPSFSTPENCYALLVRGDSMESAFGMNIPNGYYAIFCPDVIFPHAVVHVEFPCDDGEHMVTLKKYFPLSDDEVEFRPLNRDHEPIRSKQGEFIIKGGFYRAWDGSSPEK